MTEKGDYLMTEELDEESFEELVLEAQRDALEKERLERIGVTPRKKRPFFIRWTIWIIAFLLIFNTFSIILQIYSIPAIEFLKTSSKLSEQVDIQTYKKAVVEISTENSKGTGFSINTNGLIITNEHVIEDAKRLSVIFPEKGMFEAEVLASFPEVDLAFVQVKSDNQFPYLSLSNDPKWTKNSPVYFIGNPLAFTGIANEGTLLEMTELQGWHDRVMMMKAPVYRGNSGSPVLNEDGSVIGVIFATMKQEEYGRVGLFIPITTVHEKLEELY